MKKSESLYLIHLKIKQSHEGMERLKIYISKQCIGGIMMTESQEKVLIYQLSKKTNKPVPLELADFGNLRYVLSSIIKEKDLSIEQIATALYFEPQWIDMTLKGTMDLNLAFFIFRGLCDYFNIDKEVYWKYTRCYSDMAEINRILSNSLHTTK